MAQELTCIAVHLYIQHVKSFLRQPSVSRPFFLQGALARGESTNIRGD